MFPIFRPQFFLTLGETNEGALVAGYRPGGGMVEITVGVFNGKSDKASGDDTISNYVAGWSVFASATLLERFNVVAEYMSAVRAFKALEIYTTGDTQARRPAAWNLELGYAFADTWQIALRYAGSVDGDAGAGEFLPETQYGAVVNWDIFKNTRLVLEYPHGDFENDSQTSDSVVAHLAIAF